MARAHSATHLGSLAAEVPSQTHPPPNLPITMSLEMAGMALSGQAMHRLDRNALKYFLK